MKKGLLLTAVGVVAAALGVKTLLKKDDIDANEVEFIDSDEEETEASEEENSEE